MGAEEGGGHTRSWSYTWPQVCLVLNFMPDYTCPAGHKLPHQLTVLSMLYLSPVVPRLGQDSHCLHKSLYSSRANVRYKKGERANFGLVKVSSCPSLPAADWLSANSAQRNTRQKYQRNMCLTLKLPAFSRNCRLYQNSQSIESKNCKYFAIDSLY